MSDDTFGFPQRRKLAEKLNTIEPVQTVQRTDAAEKTDDLAYRHGFVSRDPQPVFKRGNVGPVVTLHTRAPVRVATPFQRFCEENRYSYWEGIEELMKRAGLV